VEITKEDCPVSNRDRAISGLCAFLSLQFLTVATNSALGGIFQNSIDRGSCDELGELKNSSLHPYSFRHFDWERI
jgi:hypothetical protein